MLSGCGETSCPSTTRTRSDAAFGAVLAAFFAQDKLIFMPRPLAEQERKTVAARHPEAGEAFLDAADGARLHAWHVKAANPAPLVIYFGGNAEEVSWMLDEIRRRGSDSAWRRLA